MLLMSLSLGRRVDGGLRAGCRVVLVMVVGGCHGAQCRLADGVGAQVMVAVRGRSVVLCLLEGGMCALPPRAFVVLVPAACAVWLS